MHPNWRRLFQIGSAPGWIGVIVFLYRIIVRNPNIDSLLNAMWNGRLIALRDFLGTPIGNVALAIAAIAWLMVLVFLPSLSRQNNTAAQPEVMGPPVIPLQPTMPAAREPHPHEPHPKVEPSDQKWIAVEGLVTQLIPDPGGCTAVLESGPDIIKARFDKTWVWYLSGLKDGTRLSIEGKAPSGQTGHQLEISDCVCPDGIRVI